MDRRLSDEKIAELLKLAKVDPNDAAARSKLRCSFNDAVHIHLYREKGRRPKADELYPPLKKVEKAAKKLIEALEELDKPSKEVPPHANSELWLNDVWERPLFVSGLSGEGGAEVRQQSLGECRDNARIGMLTALNRIAQSASEARHSPNGTPTINATKIVQCAFEFFVRVAEVKPTMDPGSTFAEFARVFNELATGEYDEGLDRAIRTAVENGKLQIAKRWPE